MIVKKYYKFVIHLPEGKLVQYIELIDCQPNRQAELYNDRWFFYSTSMNSSYLADQPISELDETIENNIDAREFEQVWAMSNNLNTPAKC
jgi:hypothetical protein